MAKSYSVTSAGVNPAEDRAHRMRMYFIAMSLRVVCVASLFWLHGWWVLIAAAGAVLLPWFAVMVGNAVAHGGEESPETPEPLRIEGGADPEPAAPADALIVVDVEPARRASGDPAADAVRDQGAPSSPGDPGAESA
ncbi:MAG: DUF3099 domain-containing protein [Leucobacter sp.]